MNKLAIFVEGQTDANFLNKLLKELIGEKGLRIEISKKAGGGFFRFIQASGDTNSKYYVQIRDCGNDGTVKTAILETWENLKNENFKFALGLRDVFPLEKAEIPKLRKDLLFNLPDPNDFLIKIILAVEEIEAWFIAENSHFLKINSILTKPYLKQKLPFDIEPNNVENLRHPAKLLNDIYILGGTRYRKNKWIAQITIDCLDYDELYLSVRTQVPSLNEMLSELDHFFS